MLYTWFTSFQMEGMSHSLQAVLKTFPFVYFYWNINSQIHASMLKMVFKGVFRNCKHCGCVANKAQ